MSALLVLLCATPPQEVGIMTDHASTPDLTRLTRIGGIDLPLQISCIRHGWCLLEVCNKHTLLSGVAASHRRTL